MTCMPYRRRQSTAPKSGAPKSVRSAAAGQSLDIDGIHLHLTRKPIKNGLSLFGVGEWVGGVVVLVG